jgi:4-amino-4-deoxy-L-arabinose transferase-like glycosyltransferase
MVFAPVAFFYSLFGINIYSATLWAFACTLACSGLIYWLYRKSNPQVTIASIVLLGLYFHNLFLATYLYPDNIVMFFAFAATAILYRYKFQKPNEKPALYALAFVLANFAAFLSKETILYYLPFYTWLFISDILRKKNTVFWLSSFLFGAIVLGSYLSFYQYYRGDWLYRFHIIEQTNLNMQDANFIRASFQSLINRLTIDPILFFIGTGIAVPLVFAIGLFRNIKWRNFLSLKEGKYFWLLLSLLVLLQFWFGSTSFSFYTPITLLPRMVTILMPPLCLAAGFGLQEFWQNKRWLAGLFAAMFLLAALIERGNLLLMYVPLATYFGWNWWQLRKAEYQISAAWGILLLIAVLSLRPLHFMRKPSLMGFQEQDKLVKKYLNEDTGKNLVIGDRWLEFISDFHYKFEANPHYQFRRFLTPAYYKTYDHIYLLLNRRSLSNPDMAKWQTVQETEIHSRFPDKKLVAQEGDVLLYQLK